MTILAALRYNGSKTIMGVGKLEARSRIFVIRAGRPDCEHVWDVRFGNRGLIISRCHICDRETHQR